MWRCLERETASRSRSGFESIGQRFRSFWRGVQREQLKPPENCAIQAQCWQSPMTRRLYWIRSNDYWQQSRRNKQQVGKVAGDYKRCCTDRLSPPPKRWGNRPALLWIAEDFGCCASG